MFTHSIPNMPHHMEKQIKKSLFLCLSMESNTNFYVIIMKFPCACTRCFLTIMALCYRVQPQQYPDITNTPMHTIVHVVK